VTQATGGPGARRVRREERSVNRGDGVWAKFPVPPGNSSSGQPKANPKLKPPEDSAGPGSSPRRIRVGAPGLVGGANALAHEGRMTKMESTLPGEA
jgi:hypothetical protein